jgi:hypothetical protein
VFCSLFRGDQAPPGLEGERESGHQLGLYPPSEKSRPLFPVTPHLKRRVKVGIVVLLSLLSAPHGGVGGGVVGQGGGVGTQGKPGEEHGVKRHGRDCHKQRERETVFRCLERPSPLREGYTAPTQSPPRGEELVVSHHHNKRSAAILSHPSRNISCDYQHLSWLRRWSRDPAVTRRGGWGGRGGGTGEGRGGAAPARRAHARRRGPGGRGGSFRIVRGVQRGCTQS